MQEVVCSDDSEEEEEQEEEKGEELSGKNVTVSMVRQWVKALVKVSNIILPNNWNGNNQN